MPDLRTLPKVELHRHLEGTLRADTVHELAAKNGVALPTEDISALYAYADLPEFLSVLDSVCTALVTADDFYRAAYESTLDAVAAGIVYTEVFVSPHHHLRRGVDFHTLWNGVTAGLRDGERDTSVVTRVILNVDKSAGAGPALELLELANDTTGYLIGIGGDGIEAGVDNTALAPAFERAAARGLRRTLHAGEFTTQSVAEAIDVLGCERIDHGPLIVGDPELTKRAADRAVAFTLCPTSDVVISKVFDSVAAHTLPEMLRRGLLVTLNSDDPALLGCDVADEYETALDAGLVDLPALRQIAVNAADACWLPEDQRTRLRKRIATAWDTAL